MKKNSVPKNSPLLSRLIVVCIAVFLIASPAVGDDKLRKGQLKAVTYNLYVGASIFRVFDPPVCGVPQAVNEILDIIQANDFGERAEAIADQIMAVDPHVIGLQEVSIIRTQFPGNSLALDGSGIDFFGEFPADPRFTFKRDAMDVQYDYLELLLNALSARGMSYVVVEEASPVNADVEFPAIPFDAACNPLDMPTDVRLTDRDVMLVRADVAVNFAIQSNFEFNAPIELPTLLPTPGGFVPAVYVAEFTRGWGAANLIIKDHNYSVVNTHLEVGDQTLAPGEGLNLVQFAQALEVGTVHQTMPEPSLLIGDINSSPFSGATDPRPAYFVLTQNFGLVDVWDAQDKTPMIPGFTCCQAETLDNDMSALDERIDVVLADFGDMATEKIKAEVLGDEAGDKTASWLWPSDHAGVYAKIKFER